MFYFRKRPYPFDIYWLYRSHTSRRGNLEEPEEVLCRRGGQRRVRNLALLRDEASDITYVRRFIRLAAIRHGREVRRVRFDQQTLERHTARDVLHVGRAFERDDARQRNVKILRQRLFGDRPRF